MLEWVQEQNNHCFDDLLLSGRRSVGCMSEIFEGFSVLLIGLSGEEMFSTHCAVKSNHILLPVTLA
ncbi:hypothetical protein EMIT0P258_80153 [Pseudomonas sp. IT-P258]